MLDLDYIDSGSSPHLFWWDFESEILFSPTYPQTVVCIVVMVGDDDDDDDYSQLVQWLSYQVINWETLSCKLALKLTGILGPVPLSQAQEKRKGIPLPKKIRLRWRNMPNIGTNEMTTSKMP